MLCCSLLQASDSVRWQPRRRGTGMPAPGGGARGGAAADSLSTAGRTYCLWLRCVRARRMSKGAACRASSAQVDRQGWASGRRGRGRPTVRRGGHGPGDGLARRRGVMQCRGRTCWANADWMYAMCAGCLLGWAWASRVWGWVRSRGLVEGGARACELRVAVRCDARVEAGTRGLAAGRARASCVTGLRNLGHRQR